jgi:hypothetical protein
MVDRSSEERSTMGIGAGVREEGGTWRREKRGLSNVMLVKLKRLFVMDGHLSRG